MPQEPQKFYLTTPIYYVNARPHIGHAYTTIVADVLARRHRLLGHDTFFLTGTDEHGQKIERSAAAANIPPQQFADRVSNEFRALWDRMGITYNDFIRTTEPRHAAGAQRLFAELYQRGHIYLDSYTGAYCVSDEAFVDAPIGTPCPDCGRLLEEVTEENFFFRLSAFQQPLLDLIESNTLRIENDSRRNEVLSFLRGDMQAIVRDRVDDILFAAPRPDGTKVHLLTEAQRRSVLAEEEQKGVVARSASGEYYVPGALKDLSVSRSSFTWGIPVPEPAASAAKDKHVIYVWLDALTNYMSAVGYGSEDPAKIAEFERYWPADLHLVGKEIIRFHCVYWPAFLIGLKSRWEAHPNGDPKQGKLVFEENSTELVPKAITAHGWLLFDNSKMSKSKGNIVRTETILDAFGEHVYAKQFPDSTKRDRDLFASDILRYFLLREIPFGQDGSFSFEALITRYNADLANGYGNLVSRTLGLISQNFADGLPQPTKPWLCEDRNVWWGDNEPKEPFEAKSGTRFIITQTTHFIEFANTDLLPASKFQIFLAELALRVSHIDAYISFHKPWLLAKASDDESRKRLIEVLYTSAEAIRILTAALFPIAPLTTARVWSQLGLGDIELAAKNGELSNLEWGGLKPGTKLGPLAPIFPRADKSLIQTMTDMENSTGTRPEAPLAATSTPTAAAPVTANSTHPAAPPRAIDSLAEPSGTLPVAGSTAHTTGPDGTPSHTAAPASGIFAAAPATPATPADATSQITIDDFAKIDLRVAQVLVAERIPKADKLLRLEVDLGPLGRRQILSGIAEHYAPEDLLGRRIVVITNLAPRKMRGLESHGMLLAASEGENGKPILATFSEHIALGSRLK